MKAPLPKTALIIEDDTGLRLTLAEVLERAGYDVRACQFVLMTGDEVGASQRDGIDFGADAYLAKPFSLAEFTACVDARFKQANL